MQDGEADYKGLLLIASAEYDPSVSPKVFEKVDSAKQNYPKRGEVN